jgi:mono/diheme cytochrome c family protein
MLVNLIIVLVVFAVAVGFALLARRAWRSKRGPVKWGGLLLSGLLTLIVGFIGVLGVIGMTKLYLPTSEPIPNLSVEGTPEQIARGEYLANIGCAGCHGVEGKFPLTGGFDLGTESPVPFGSLVASNLTPTGVLKDRTDGELFRAIRHGYGKDNLRLVMMSSLPYRELSDDDIEAIIAYLRSQQPAANDVQGGDNVNFIGVLLVGTGLLPDAEPIRGVVTAPPREVSADYGKYVATFGECRGCHGPDMTGTPPSAVQPAGVPNPRPIVGTWTVEQFVQTMRSGVRPGGVAFPGTMPWQNASRMDDTDLSALYAYITTNP